MEYPFVYKHWILVNGRQLVLAESEMVANLAPAPDDASDWIVADIAVFDVVNDEWVTLPADDPWRSVFEQTLEFQRTAVDGEWIAHRNAEGDAALYGQEA
jgi:hypothetical protein